MRTISCASVSVRVHYSDSLGKEMRYVMTKWCSNTLPSSGWKAVKRNELEKNSSISDCDQDNSSNSCANELEREVSDSDDDIHE